MVQVSLTGRIPQQGTPDALKWAHGLFPACKTPHTVIGHEPCVPKVPGALHLVRDIGIKETSPPGLTTMVP